MIYWSEYADPKVRIEFEAREKSLKDKTSALNYARAKGKEEGLAEARDIIEKAKAEARDIIEKSKAEIEKAKAETEKIIAETEKIRAEAKENELKIKLEHVRNILDLADDETISKKIGIDVYLIKNLREETQQ